MIDAVTPAAGRAPLQLYQPSESEGAHERPKFTRRDRGPSARRGCQKPERAPSERMSAADLIWKEKLHMSVTPTEALVSLLAIGVSVSLMFALGS
jgi:hypothetical protein